MKRFVKPFGIILVLAGLILIGWSGFQYWQGMQSVEKIDGEQIVKESYTNPFLEDEEQKSTGPVEENADFESGDHVAVLVMPSIDLVFDVFMGTDDNVLAKGVGMYQSDLTTTPDGGGHTVLSGHRDGVFSPVGELEHDDSLYVRYQGVDYHYQIVDTWITDADDLSVIVEKDEPILTLSTCYPFRFVGSAPERYIVEAKLVEQGDLLDLK